MAVSTITNVADDFGETFKLLANRIPIDMDPVIKLLEPDDSSFVKMYMNLPSRPAQSQKVEWLEDELLPRIAQINGALTSGGVTITVGTGQANYFRAGDIARIAETGENVLVTVVASSTTLTVVRGYGSVVGTAITITTGDLIRLGNAAVEGDTLGPIVMTKQVAQSNYCQIFRNALAFTGTAEATTLYGGREPAWEAKKKLLEHRGMLELQSFFGSRKLDVAGTNNITSALVTTGAATHHSRAVMGGVMDFLTSNTVDVNGSLTAATFEAFLRKAFRYADGDNKVFFCSPLIASVLASFPLGKLAPPSPSVKTWGVALSSYQSAQGQTVKIAVKQDWQDYQFAATSGKYAGLGGFGVIVDLDNIRYRPLRSTVLKPNRQAPSEDSTIQEYFTEASLQVIHERTHAWITGVTG